MRDMKEIVIVLLVAFFALVVPALSDWDKTKPADNRDYDLRDNDIRTNNTAIETAFGNEHEFETDGVQTGEPNEGHAKAYYESSEPTLRPDGSTSLDANDAGRLWYDSDVNQIYVYSGNEWEQFTETNTYNVLEYGATGDGSTDDSTAIQAAITAANAAGGGLVTIPNGTYMLDTALVPKSYVTVRGQGFATILKASASNNDGIFVDTPGSDVWLFVLERLAFRSVDKDVSMLENKSTTEYYGYFAVRDCEIWAEFDVAIKGLFGHSSFEKCRFGYNGTAPTDWQPVSLVGQASCSIFSNRFVQCGFYNGTDTQDSMVHLETGVEQVFENCIFEASDAPAIYAKGVKGVRLTEGTTLENIDCSNAAQDAPIYLVQDTVLTQGSTVYLSGVKFQNNATDTWDALVYRGASCFASIDGCEGNVNSYWVYDGSSYDTVTNLLYTRHNDVLNYSGSLLPSFFGFGIQTEGPLQIEGGGTVRTQTLIYTIDLDDDASTDDYQFDDDAANSDEQVITLTDILPAYAELVSVQLRCIEAVGAGTFSVDFGTSSGGDEISSAANIDGANDITVTEAGGSPELGATNAARSLYFNGNPSVNWSAAGSAGRWAVMLTIIDYGQCYSDN